MSSGTVLRVRAIWNAETVAQRRLLQGRLCNVEIRWGVGPLSDLRGLVACVVSGKRSNK
jgi:hypothetical protein